MKRNTCKEVGHTWIGGMFYIHYEDVEEAARHRHVQCEKCDLVYVPREEL